MIAASTNGPTNNMNEHVPMLDAAPQRSDMLADVLEALTRTPRHLPSKLFYDLRGSELFEQICELDEYYPTRTELGIMQANAGEMAGMLPADGVLIEYGSGASLKTRILLDHAERLRAYVPVDISGDHLHAVAGDLQRAYPDVPIRPVCADYTQPFELPGDADGRPRAVYFPGSTIGNFEPADARPFLGHIAHVVGPGGGLLIGVDLHKDTTTLEAAYNDAAGVTAEFNLNLLVRLNRDLGADFDLDHWRHHAIYNEPNRRIEMHLVSQRDQVVTISGRRFRFRAGEPIVTEYSHKYTLPCFARLAREGGFAVRQVWTDEQARFSVQYLVAA